MKQELAQFSVLFVGRPISGLGGYVNLPTRVV